MPLMTGRCVAPPLTDQHLRDWPTLAEQVGGEAGGAMRRLLRTVQAAKEAETIPPALPRPALLEQWQVVFERLEEPHRTPAFHLLWYVKELTLGRHPR